jgi:N-methylhydantoinase A
MKIIGCDVGGTFTDLIQLDTASGALGLVKVPTTTQDPSVGVVDAIDATTQDVAEIGLIVHGTTVTTNALLERKLARCGLITTKGFRDVLELGRRTRPHGYGMIAEFEPLIPRDMRFEVPERMSATGEVLTPLDEAALAEAIRRLDDLGAESLVIHFLHSYANPAHENRALEIALSLWRNGFVCAGHAIMAEFREYERGVTAAVNASVQPILSRYIGALQRTLRERGYERDFLVMQGNGGTVSSQTVTARAVQTVMSGPASGVIAAAHVASLAGFDNIVTCDMGGTSTDVALIQNGMPLVSPELELEYAMPIRVPLVDVHTIGAGGGSIARVTEAGLLHVGPESAGSHPGPICFGRGGVEPTITDANLVLGRLNPDRLTGVDKHVPLDVVRNRITEKIATPLGLDCVEAAEAILQVANDRMAGALRLVSLQRGHDPRDFALFAFGGAGPLHAAALARELAVPKVLIPARPGMTNALGCIVADLRHDFVRTVNQPVETLDPAIVAEALAAHIDEGRRKLADEDIEIEDVKTAFSAGMQFKGQSHQLDIGFDAMNIGLDALVALFEDAFHHRFHVRLPDATPVLVNLHTAVIGRRKKLDLRGLGDPTDDTGDGADTPGRRPVRFSGAWHDTPICRRADLKPNARFVGPAIVEQLDCTAIVDPGDEVLVDAFGNLIVTLKT